MKNIKTFIEESLNNHLCISSKANINNIQEKNGKLNGVEKIIQKIIDDIFINKIKSNYLFEYDNNKINIHISTKHSKSIIASYNQSKTDYDNNIVYIELEYFDNNDIDKISNLFSHEILHAVEDIIAHYELNDELKNSTDNIRNASHIPSIVKQLSIYVYLLNYHERNAYMSQLTNDIKNIINNHNWNDMTIDYKELVNELKTSNNIWKVYFNFYSFINDFKNDNSGIYIREYNKITNNNFTKNKAIKELTNKFNKFKNKFNTLVPKIVYDNLPKYEGLLPSGLEKYLFI